MCCKHVTSWVTMWQYLVSSSISTFVHLRMPHVINILQLTWTCVINKLHLNFPCVINTYHLLMTHVIICVIHEGWLAMLYHEEVVVNLTNHSWINTWPNCLQLVIYVHFGRDPSFTILGVHIYIVFQTNLRAKCHKTSNHFYLFPSIRLTTTLVLLTI
jgi:hypothetical protein